MAPVPSLSKQHFGSKLNIAGETIHRSERSSPLLVCEHLQSSDLAARARSLRGKD